MSHIHIINFYMCLIHKRRVLVMSDSGQQHGKMNMAHEGGGLTKELWSMGTHFGRASCVVLITKRYDWQGITAGITKYLEDCHKG